MYRNSSLSSLSLSLSLSLSVCLSVCLYKKKIHAHTLFFSPLSLSLTLSLPLSLLPSPSLFLSPSFSLPLSLSRLLTLSPPFIYLYFPNAPIISSSSFMSLSILCLFFPPPAAGRGNIPFSWYQIRYCRRHCTGIRSQIL